MKTITTAIIGLGSRGYSLLRDVVLTMEDVKVIGVCDLFEDRVQRAADAVREKEGRVSKKSSQIVRHIFLNFDELLCYVL